MDILVGTPDSIATPPAGYVTLFINTAAGNVLYAKFSDGTTQPYNGAGAESAVGLAQSWTEGVMCAAKKGTITATEFQAIMDQGFTVESITNTDEDGNTTITVNVGSRGGAS